MFGNRTKHKGVNRCPQNPLLTQADQSAHSVWPWHYCWIDSWRISDRPAWLALGVLHQCTHRFGGARWFENTCRSGIAQGTPDLTGALSSIIGMAALVYGITRGGEHGWTDGITLIAFATTAILLPLFLVLQSRSSDPLLPLRLFKDRNRSGSYLAMLLLGFGPMGMIYLLTLYLQHILSYSPTLTAMAFLPFGVGIIIGAVVSSKLVMRFTPREVAAPAALVASAALFWLSTIGQQLDYSWHFMPAAFLTAFGFVGAVIALALTAVKGVQAQETGIASALFNASQQIGVALGLAILSSISVSVTASRMPEAFASLYRGREVGDAELVQSAGDALIQGYGLGLAASGVALGIAAIIVAVLVNARKGQVSTLGDSPLH